MGHTTWLATPPTTSTKNILWLWKYWKTPDLVGCADGPVVKHLQVFKLATTDGGSCAATFWAARRGTKGQNIMTGRTSKWCNWGSICKWKAGRRAGSLSVRMSPKSVKKEGLSSSYWWLLLCSAKQEPCPTTLYSLHLPRRPNNWETSTLVQGRHQNMAPFSTIVKTSYFSNECKCLPAKTMSLSLSTARKQMLPPAAQACIRGCCRGWPGGEIASMLRNKVASRPICRFY